MARPTKKKTPKTLFAKRLMFLFDGKNILDFETKYGLAGGQIGKYIAGREPTRPNLEAIIKGTGCNAAWLISGDGEPFEQYNEMPPQAEAFGGMDAELKDIILGILVSVAQAGRHLADGASLSTYPRLDELRDTLSDVIGTLLDHPATNEDQNGDGNDVPA